MYVMQATAIVTVVGLVALAKTFPVSM